MRVLRKPLAIESGVILWNEFLLGNPTEMIARIEN